MLMNEAVRTAAGQVDRNRDETFLVDEFEIVEFEDRTELASAITPKVAGMRASHAPMQHAPAPQKRAASATP